MPAVPGNLYYGILPLNDDIFRKFKLAGPINFDILKSEPVREADLSVDLGRNASVFLFHGKRTAFGRDSEKIYISAFTRLGINIQMTDEYESEYHGA